MTRLNIASIIAGITYTWFVLTNVIYPSNISISSPKLSLPSQCQSYQYLMMWLMVHHDPIDLQYLKNALIDNDNISIALWNKTYEQFLKACFQCGLVFLFYQRRVLNKQLVLPIACLPLINFICWKMIHTCMEELLNPNMQSYSRSEQTIAELQSTFLHTLFTFQYALVAILNLALGYFCQKYFCKSPEKWRDIPKYIGSINLLLSTLHYAVGVLGLLLLFCSSLRTMNRAIVDIERFATCGLIVHCVYSQLIVWNSLQYIKKSEV